MSEHKAVLYGNKVKIVGNVGRMMILTPEEAIALAHDIIEKADMAMKKAGESTAP